MQTKGLRAWSLFFKLQEKYFSLEVINNLEQLFGTIWNSYCEKHKVLSSGKTSALDVLIQIRYSRLLKTGLVYWISSILIG